MAGPSKGVAIRVVQTCNLRQTGSNYTAEGETQESGQGQRFWCFRDVAQLRNLAACHQTYSDHLIEVMPYT